MIMLFYDTMKKIYLKSKSRGGLTRKFLLGNQIFTKALQPKDFTTFDKISNNANHIHFI